MSNRVPRRHYLCIYGGHRSSLLHCVGQVDSEKRCADVDAGDCSQSVDHTAIFSLFFGTVWCGIHMVVTLVHKMESRSLWHAGSGVDIQCHPLCLDRVRSSLIAATMSCPSSVSRRPTAFVWLLPIICFSTDRAPPICMFFSPQRHTKRCLPGSKLFQSQVISASYHDFLDDAQLPCLILRRLLESFLYSVKGPFRDLFTSFLKEFLYSFQSPLIKATKPCCIFLSVSWLHFHLLQAFSGWRFALPLALYSFSAFPSRPPLETSLLSIFLRKKNSHIPRIYWSYPNILHKIPLRDGVPLPLRQGCISFCHQIFL